MTTGKPSKLPPREPCYVLFKGYRRIKAAIYEHIHEPLQIVRYTNGKSTELSVCMLGRATKYPVAVFDGEWTVMQLEAQGD